MNLERQKIDASGMTLGRLASRIAVILRGKHRVDFDPAAVPPVQVQVDNARLIRLTGKKYSQKLSYRFSGYPGGLKRINFSQLFQRSPDQVIRSAVKNMLPANKLRPRLLKRLTINS